MAELILTDKEKEFENLLDFDDASIGRLVRAGAFALFDGPKSAERAYFMSAAIVLCTMAAESNAHEFKQKITGVTKSGKHMGDWEVIIKRLSE